MIGENPARQRWTELHRHLDISMRMANFEQHIQHCTHRLDLTVKSAEGLPNVDKIGKSDPYVKVFFDDGVNGEKEVGETDPIQDTLNPAWDLPFPALAMEAAEHLGWSGKIRLLVMDREKVGQDREIGEATVQITGKRMPFPLSKMVGDKTLPLTNKVADGRVCGERCLLSDAIKHPRIVLPLLDHMTVP